LTFVLISDHRSGSNSGSGSPRSKPNGTSGSSHGEDFDEPFDFKADDFVSAIDKLLHGKLNRWSMFDEISSTLL
jgi:hypothetical protein